ncbi:MAG: DUF3139 domain-containing protein [Chloroflexi bacterium]|nr:DUF3139 domain-containing protein [Chloroflexota bacterium]
MFSMVGRFILIGLIVGVILGLIVGLLVGWVVWPVKWHYANQWIDDYVVLVSKAYVQDNDLARAQWRLEATLEWPPAEQGQRITEVLTRYQEYCTPQETTQLKALMNALGGTAPTPMPGSPVPTSLAPTSVGPGTQVPLQTPTAGGGLDLGGLVGSLLPVCCVGLIAVLVVVAVVLLWTNRSKFLGGLKRGPAWTEEGEAWTTVEPGMAPAGPHMRFTARYALGQDNYEESFSVESAAGGFFGECGVSAAERLGKEGPDKVTAFDVWLFDVASRETVTKVLLSDWGYKDDPLRTQLISRGGVILAEKGKVVTLETQNLRVDIKVVDFGYGDQDGLPDNSFFSFITLDMVAQIKEA